MRHHLLLATAALLSLGACNKTETTEPASTKNVEVAKSETVSPAEGGRFADWAGRWIGPEGTYVDIKSLGDGRFELEMQSDLDAKGTYEAQGVEHGIEFRRDGAMHTLTRTDGDGTGMKWLAGKKECLMVKEGEGYCRD